MHKLLQINIVSNLLSTGTIVEDISKVAQKRGWDTYVCYGRKAMPGVNKEYRIGSKLELIWHYIENRILDNEGLASRFATYRLLRYIKKINPDVVHLHNIHDHYLNYKILFNFLNKQNIQVVWTFHDFWAITGHCHYFIKAHCDFWKIGCHDCPLQHDTVNSMFDQSRRNYELKKSVFSNSKNLTIVPVSFWVGDKVMQSFLSSKHIEVIPNGIDTSFFHYHDGIDCSLLPKDKFVILGVAVGWSFGDRKGLDDYVKLSHLLGDDEIICLVGMSEVLASKMPPNIIGLKRINNKKTMRDIYSTADVLLSLSKAETFGMTIVEAQACGTPAIVYDNTAPPSLIINEKTGFVAKNNDVEDVYNKIQVIKQKGKQSYRDACVKHVKENYDKNKNYSKYIDLYESLINVAK